MTLQDLVNDANEQGIPMDHIIICDPISRNQLEFNQLVSVNSSGDQIHFMYITSIEFELTSADVIDTLHNIQEASAE